MPSKTVPWRPQILQMWYAARKLLLHRNGAALARSPLGGRGVLAASPAPQLKPQLPNQVHDAFALTANGAKSNDHWWDFGNQIRSLGMIFLMPVLY